MVFLFYSVNSFPNNDHLCIPEIKLPDHHVLSFECAADFYRLIFYFRFFVFILISEFSLVCLMTGCAIFVHLGHVIISHIE